LATDPQASAVLSPQIAFAALFGAKADLAARLGTRAPVGLSRPSAGDAAWEFAGPNRDPPVETEVGVEPHSFGAICPPVSKTLGARTAALEALSAYLDALQAVAAARGSVGFDEDAQALRSSTSAFVCAEEAALAPHSAARSFGKGAAIALPQAPYETLRASVLRVDPLLEGAVPFLSTAARVAQARELDRVSQDAGTALDEINAALDAPDTYGRPADLFDVYDRLAAVGDQLADVQRARREDPAKSLRNLIDAHHRLANSLRSSHGDVLVLSSRVDHGPTSK
jgi:hypothetical protein